MHTSGMIQALHEHPLEPVQMAAMQTLILIMLMHGSLCSKWTPSFFQECGVLQDGVMKAELCYTRYEREIMTGTSAYCCPNWKLADCLISSVAPSCSNDVRRNLTNYWHDFFTNSTCPSLIDHLDGSGVPTSCTWYYHYVLILRAAVGSLVTLLIVAVVIAAVFHQKQQKRIAETTSSYESFNFARKTRQ